MRFFYPLIVITLLTTGCNNIQSKLTYEPLNSDVFVTDHYLKRYRYHSKTLYVTWDSLRVVDKKKGELISDIHKMRYEIGGRLFILKVEDNWGAINDQYEVIIPFVNDTLYSYAGYDIKFSKKKSCMAQKKGKFGFYDTTGKLIIPFEYEWGDNRYINDFIVKKNGKVGIIDKNNETTVPFVYDSIYRYEDHTFYAIQNDKIGLINNRNEILIPVVNDSMKCLGNLTSDKNGNFYSLFTAKQNGKWGIYNNIGNQIIAPFSDSRIEGLIDNRTEKGRLINIESIFDDDIPESFFKFTRGTFCGILNSNGKIITDPIYDSIRVDRINANLSFYKNENIQSKKYNLTKMEIILDE